MGRKRKSALSEEKRNIIGQLLEIYDIKTAADIQEALKDLLGGTLQSMLEAELEAVLDAHGIFYDKTEVWIESEKLYEVLYQFEMGGMNDA